MTRFHKLDDDGNAHFYNLEGDFFYPLCPVNVLGVTKIDIDNNNHNMIIQNFAHAPNFTWNHNACQMSLKHRPKNLPDFSKSWSHTTIFALAAAASKEQFNKSTPDGVTKKFGFLSKK